MSSKKPRGNIHKIQEFELEKISLIDEFDILQIVGEGWFGKILLVEHRASQTEMVLKAVPKPYVSLREFYREFHYGLHLGIHRNIVTTFDVAFETAGFYVFTQEYAPLGDLTSNVSDTGVGEVYSKRVAKQIASAIDYMHSKDIVHRDVKLDNILIYRSDFSKVKLCDFGESFQTGTLVERRNEWLPYSPPEILEVKTEETYKADPSHDVWQFAIVIFVCLTGCLPWQKAASDDPRYMRYLAWQGSMMLPIRRTPKLFKLLSSRAQRMFRRFLEPKADKRPKNLTDISKFMDDRWLAKTAEKEMAEFETDELCPSMYSFHSSPDEKNRLLYTLADCGIETNVDRQAKKNRIKDWIESSVITEEDEEEDTNSASASASSSISREPVAGHVSSLRAAEKAKEIKTTLKDASQKHFDPRTGALQHGPSEMGVVVNKHDKSPSYSQMSNISTLNNNASLNSSLITLGSRQDLIGSNMQMYNSMETELNHLGEPYYHQHSNNHFDSYYDRMNEYKGAALSIDNLHKLSDSPANLQSSNYQRSKSDSVKTALFASSPNIINQINNFQPPQQLQQMQQQQQQMIQKPQAQKQPQQQQQQQDRGYLNPASGFIPNSKDFFQNTASPSATFTGLANNLQTLTSLTLGPLITNSNSNSNTNSNSNSFSHSNAYNNPKLSQTLTNNNNNINTNNNNNNKNYQNASLNFNYNNNQQYLLLPPPQQQQKQQLQLQLQLQLQQQQLQANNLVQQNIYSSHSPYPNNSPVKDSAYSSLETNDYSSSPAKQGPLYQDSSQQQRLQYTANKTISSVRTQTSQQQRLYNGTTTTATATTTINQRSGSTGANNTNRNVPTTLHKDSAYERIATGNRLPNRR